MKLDSTHASKACQASIMTTVCIALSLSLTVQMHNILAIGNYSQQSDRANAQYFGNRQLLSTGVADICWI